MYGKCVVPLCKCSKPAVCPHRAEKGELDPFVLVVEGSIPNEKIKSKGYWAAFG